MKPLRNGVIHRTELPIADQTDQTDQRIPGFRKVLHVAAHRDQAACPDILEVWYERDAALADEVLDVRFHVVGTGNPFAFRTGHTYAEHVGTVPTHQGRFVWHVYVEYPIVVPYE